MFLRQSLVGAAALLATASAFAQFTTVDISSAVNGNIDRGTSTFPVGLSTGNESTGIPFLVSSYPADGGYAGSWIGTGSGSSVTVAVNAPGQASFYALLNNYFGTPGANEYDITITATNGDTVTYQSIGGVDTRDFNSNVYTNTIANSTTPWFDNGIGQRLDLREFSLPTSFLAETVATFAITQINGTDSALFTGLTFSSQPLVSPVPEPETYGLMLAGFGALGLVARRRRGQRA